MEEETMPAKPTEGSLNPIQAFLLERIGKNLDDSDEIQKLTDKFLLNNNTEASITEDNAYTAYMIALFFPQKITPEQSAKLYEVIDISSKKFLDFKYFRGSISYMQSEVNHYFRTSEMQYEYFIPTKSKNVLGELLLNLSCQTVVAQKREQFKKNNQSTYLIDSFVSPYSGVRGIWMSKHGLDVDLTKINKPLDLRLAQ